MEFFTKYFRPKLVEEVGSPEIKVERTGYINQQVRIEEFLAAGKRLQMSRSDQFDFPDGVDDGREPDPIRRSNYDLVDAANDLAAIEERRKRRQNEKNEPPVKKVEEPEIKAEPQQKKPE